MNQGITVKKNLVGLALEEKLTKMEKLRQDLYSLSIIGDLVLEKLQSLIIFVINLKRYVN